MSAKRKSYSLNLKMQILQEYKPNTAGNGYAALAAKHNLSTSTIRGWMKNQNKLHETIKDANICTRVARRLRGGGRNPEFNELESKLIEWIKSRNEKGLRVKDKYITARAVTIKNDFNDEIYTNFKASAGWLSRFKTRYNLVSRRQTTCRTLPKDADKIVREFIYKIQKLIDEHQIEAKNILNMDQVPRYFECEPTSTITFKGIRNVIMRKASSSHKKFTATFTISADGQILKPHLLFSKLKNVPKVDSNCIVEVNNTGMWSSDTLKCYMNSVILKRPQTSLLRQPTLLIIDSYGPHISLANCNSYEKHNVFIAIVPPKMTGLLQPLDVVCNKIFQEHYNDCYDKYISDAIHNSQKQTKQGNPKMPPYNTVSEWVVDFTKHLSVETIIKAFVCCGIIEKGKFDIEKLHPPLKQIYKEDVDIEEWISKFKDKIFINNQNFFEEIGDCNFFWPETMATSFFECIKHVKLVSVTYEQWFPDFLAEILNFLESNVSDLIDDEDKKILQAGRSTESNIEIYAVSFVENWNITVITLDRECNKIEEHLYSVMDAVKDIQLIRIENYYGLKL